jgi:antitoxin PrlF
MGVSDKAWYDTPMIATIDKAGRVVIPAEVRKRLGLAAGMELEMVVEGFAIRLVRSVAGPELVRRGRRLVARPRIAEGERTEVDVAQLIEESQNSPTKARERSIDAVIGRMPRDPG